MLQNTPSCTTDMKSEEYVPIPLNIVCAVLYYLLFLYKKMTYYYNFFYKILAKYSVKRTRLHHFKNFSWWSIPPNPPSECVVFTYLSKNILNPPPPPK